MSASESNIQALLQWANGQLAGSESPGLDSRILLAHCLNCTQATLLTWPERLVAPLVRESYTALVAKRKAGHPVAHLIGQKAFWTLDLAVNPSTLIPRPETELLIEEALNLPLPNDSTVLDLGTGTGAIALALASEKPGWQITGVDKQQDAVALALANSISLNLQQVRFKQSDWFSNLSDEKYDLIVSNPPYVEDSSPYLSRGDVRFEPESALTSGVDGLDDIRLITEHAGDYLTHRGWLLFEHGHEQSDAVQVLLASNGMNNIRTVCDLNGLPRVTMGCNNN